MNKNNQIKYFVTIGTIFILIVASKLDFFSILGIALFVFFMIKFFVEIGEKIEIRDIIIIMATLQWIIGPILTYLYYPNDNIYYMAVSQKEYMNFVVPATYAFVFGMYFPIKSRKKSHVFYLEGIKEFVKRNKNWDLILIAIGIIAGLGIDFVPESLKFVLFLFSGLRFIGLYFLFVSERKKKMIWVYLILGWLFVTALNDSMFHELLLWLGFFAIIVAFITKPKILRKLSFSILIIVLLVVIQTVKFSYRQVVSVKSGDNIALFYDLVKEQVFNGTYLSSDANIKAGILRINQGWIVARIMHWTPAYEPFANGETIKDAVVASFVPRLLAPDKVTAGGRTYFKRFTGKNISDNTSMGLGLIGEAYANYGINGGIFFMLVIALVYNVFLVVIYKIAIKHPTLIFFLPLIFLQVVKAEIDFSVILNHLVKASLIVWFLYFSLRKFLNLNI